MINVFKIIFSVLVALSLTVFAVKNSIIVTLNFWPFPVQLNLTLSLVLLGVFAVGAVFGGGLVWISQVTKRLFQDKPK